MATVNKRHRIHLTKDQIEYNYIKNLNKDLKIKSKQHYLAYATQFMYAKYIYNPEAYFGKKGLWISWDDFLDKEPECLEELQEENIYPEKKLTPFDEYQISCQKITGLPRESSCFYIGKSDKPNIARSILPIQPTPSYQVLHNELLLCNCSATTDIHNLCTPSSPSWKNCMEKLRYASFIITHMKYTKTNKYQDMYIYFDKNYFKNMSPKYIVRRKQTIDDIMLEFKLSRREFNELIGMMFFNYINKATAQ